MNLPPDSNRTAPASPRHVAANTLICRQTVSPRLGVGSVLLILILTGLSACTAGSASDESATGREVDDVTEPRAVSASEPEAEPEPGPEPESEPEPIDIGDIWMDPSTLRSLPMSGKAWEAIQETAEGEFEKPDLDDLTNDHDVQVLAAALYAARTGDTAMLDKVESALAEVTGMSPSKVLPLARNLLSYVIAADLVGYRPPEFTSWLQDLLDAEADGRAGIASLRQSAMTDPSNHGTHARASVLAVALFTDDEQLADTVADRFHDWLGRSSEGFIWKELDWQSDPSRPVGINPVGSRIDDLPVDGVLPEEQRRSGGFEVPPPREGYVWEALQGAVATGEMLDRIGYPAWEWEDRALLRAFTWLYDVNDYPAKGDDRWQVWLVNKAYGTDFETRSPTQPGKNIGYTDWTHQGS